MFDNLNQSDPLLMFLLTSPFLTREEAEHQLRRLQADGLASSTPTPLAAHPMAGGFTAFGESCAVRIR